MDTPKITQKEAFLKYLQRMDIEMLEMILDDSIICFGASKKVFLEKLSYIFNLVKSCGEKGDLKIKQHKKQNNIYYLLFQSVSHSIKFNIEEKEGNILQLHSTRTKISPEDIEMLSSFEIFFGDDEKVDFKPSTEYVMNLHKCINAYEEVYNGEIQILTRDDIYQWMNKHALLYKEVKNDYLLFKQNDFRDLYTTFELLLEELQHYKEVKMALESFNNSNSTTLNEWLEDYNRLAFCRVSIFESMFIVIDEANKILKYRPKSTIYFKGDDFFSINKFNELYHKHFS